MCTPTRSRLVDLRGLDGVDVGPDGDREDHVALGEDPVHPVAVDHDHRADALLHQSRGHVAERRVAGDLRQPVRGDDPDRVLPATPVASSRVAVASTPAPVPISRSLVIAPPITGDEVIVRPDHVGR